LIYNNTRAKNWVLGLGIAFIFFVGYARLYVGVHYFSDVLASVFASAAGILIFNQVWLADQRGSDKKRGALS